MKTQFISAILTPLKPDDSLHTEGLQRHVDEQWQAGINGILVGGTMGLMQLLPDRTYRDLVGNSVKFTAGRGEVLIGVGDTSFARTRERIEFVQRLDVDGVVVVSPYLIKFTEDQLVDYFRSLADYSKKPLYLYNLPQLTRVELTLPTILKLAEHPNIRGIKCSNEFPLTRLLIEAVGDRFRVIVAQPHCVDILARSGIQEHLDGIFAVAPRWAVGIGRAIDQGDPPRARGFQSKVSTLLRTLLERYLLFPAVTAILNARGTCGKMAPAPIGLLSEPDRQRLLAEPIIEELLATK